MANIRQGIPHLFSTLTEKGNLTPSISDYEFQRIIENGKVSLRNVTEKTDGQTMIIGYDWEGFYTRSSGTSDIRVRDGAQYVRRAKERGNSIEVAYAFAEFHHVLRRNDNLQKLLEYCMHDLDEEVVVRGEVFNRLLIRETNGHYIKFVHTYYDSRTFGDFGSFIIHSALEENTDPSLFVNNIKALSNKDIVFDHDKIDIDEDIGVNWDYSREDIHKLIHNRLDKVKPKWGNETEGWVIHGNSDIGQPTFKVISDSFKKTKEQANGW